MKKTITIIANEIAKELEVSSYTEIKKLLLCQLSDLYHNDIDKFLNEKIECEVELGRFNPHNSLISILFSIGGLFLAIITVLLTGFLRYSPDLGRMVAGVSAVYICVILYAIKKNLPSENKNVYYQFKFNCMNEILAQNKIDKK